MLVSFVIIFPEVLVKPAELVLVTTTTKELVRLKLQLVKLAAEKLFDPLWIVKCSPE